MATEPSINPAADAKTETADIVGAGPVAKIEADSKPESVGSDPVEKAAVPAPVSAVESQSAPVAAPKSAPVAAPKSAPVAAPKSAPVAAEAEVVKRGRGRPRKTEAEKALTIALRKEAAAVAVKKIPAVSKPAKTPVQSKPEVAAVAAKSVKNPTERKHTVVDNNLLPGLGTLPGVEQFQTVFAEANAKGREALSKSAKVAEELVDLTKANVEAVVSSGRIAAAGVQALGQEAVASSKGRIERASAAVKGFAEAKSPTELFQLQSDFARSSFDRLVAESSKMTESFVKLFGEAMEPLSNRASINAERLNTFIA